MDKYVKITDINISPKLGTFYYDDIVDVSKQVYAIPVDYTKMIPEGSKYLRCAKCGQFIELAALHRQFWNFCPFCGRIIIK